jgi:hypothetical protein
VSNTLVQQWVEMGQTSLNALKQLSESNAATLGNALDLQFNGSDLATMLQALLDSNKQLGDLNSAMFTGLFYRQLKTLDLGGAAAALQDLTSTNTAFVNGLVQKQMSMASDFTGMLAGYLTDLQNTRSLDDIALLQTAFFNNLEQKIKDNGNDIGQLLLSAKTAATAWTERALNRAIESGNGAAAGALAADAGAAALAQAG